MSTTPPDGIPSKCAGAKPAGIFYFTPLDDSGNDEEPGSPLFHKKKLIVKDHWNSVLRPRKLLQCQSCFQKLDQRKLFRLHLNNPYW